MMERELEASNGENEASQQDPKQRGAMKTESENSEDENSERQRW